MTEREEERGRQLLSVWRGAVVPVAEPADDAAAREKRVRALQRMIARAPAEGRNLQRRRWVALSVAAGVMALVGVAGILGVGSRGEVASGEARGVRESSVLVAAAPQSQGHLHFVRGRVVATSGDVSRVVNAEESPSVLVGDEVSTAADASAVIEFNGGARVDLSAATTVRVERASEHDHVLVVGAGRLDVNVPEGNPTQRSFVVRTPNAKVVVHGTIFSVEVGRGDGAEWASRVQVTRGVVSVESGGKRDVLRAGQSWSSTIAVTEASPAADSAQRPLVGKGLRAVPSPATETKEVDAAAMPKSSLAEENRIFELGLAARERGDFAEAERQFEDLLARYPRSQVVQAARIQLEAARKGQRGSTRR